MSHQISAVLIVRDEMENLPACLDGLSWCDEIVVVDSGSSDGSPEYCASRGCVVHHHPFDGFGKQKQFACSLATSPWILSIDADEIVSSELAKEILSLVKTSNNRIGNNNTIINNVVAYGIPRRFCFLGKKFEHGHGSVDYPERLFLKGLAHYDDSLVHERLVIEGQVGRCRSEMLHVSYRSLEQYVQKFNHYTTLAARQLFNAGKRRSVVLTAILLPLYFIKHYVLWRHFLNGWQGLVWSVLSAIYPLVKVAKAQQLR